MPTLTINNQTITVPEGTTLYQAALQLGVQIPTMCYLHGQGNHPSCMVCLVKNKHNNQLVPSCAHPALEGMEIETEGDDIFAARKQALDLLLSDHVGDCEAPCRVACPANMDIPLMNRLLQEGRFSEARKVVQDEIALPLILGHVCSAPCEKACKRSAVDTSLSICQLKKSAAVFGEFTIGDFNPGPGTGKQIAIIGAGIAGMTAAYHLTRLGNSCTVFEQEDTVGGSLLAFTESVLPYQVINTEFERLKNLNIRFECKETIDVIAFHRLVDGYNAVLISTGKPDADLWDLPMEKDKGVQVDEEGKVKGFSNVFACGSVVRERKMAVQVLAHAKEISYQLHKNISNPDFNIPIKRFNSRFGKLQQEEFNAYLAEAKGEEVPNIENALNGFSKNQVMQEAARCMHCDCRKLDNCKLRLYAETYQVNPKPYQIGKRQLVKKFFSDHGIVYEEEKCIRCGLCVDIASAENEKLGLTYVGRGFDVRIGVPFNESLSEALQNTANKCAQACPTGALAKI
jgi:ferredoxin